MEVCACEGGHEMGAGRQYGGCSSGSLSSKQAPDVFLPHPVPRVLPVLAVAGPNIPAHIDIVLCDVVGLYLLLLLSVRGQRGIVPEGMGCISYLILMQWDLILRWH